MSWISSIALFFTLAAQGWCRHPEGHGESSGWKGRSSPSSRYPLMWVSLPRCCHCKWVWWFTHVLRGLPLPPGVPPFDLTWNTMSNSRHRTLGAAKLERVPLRSDENDQRTGKPGWKSWYPRKCPGWGLVEREEGGNEVTLLFKREVLFGLRSLPPSLPPLSLYGSKMEPGMAGSVSAGGEGVGSWPRVCWVLTWPWGGAEDGHVTTNH